MSRLTRDGTAEPVSRDQILRHAQGQGNVNFPCSADHEQDWQPYPVDPYSAICDDHTYIHTYCILTTLIAMQGHHTKTETMHECIIKQGGSNKTSTWHLNRFPDGCNLVPTV